MQKTHKYIYLDTVASASNETSINDMYANPNALHNAGRNSFNILESSRKTIAQAINAKRPTEIIFTSGATEANNLAIFGIARAVADKHNLREKYLDNCYKNKYSANNNYKTSKNFEKICNLDNQNYSNFNNNSKNPKNFEKKYSNFVTNKPKVIISAIEHESIIEPTLALKNELFDIETIQPDKNGFIKKETLEKAMSANVVLVSIQLANTEIGTIQSIKDLADVSHENGAYFHTDIVGAFGKIPVDIQDLNVDACSISGHKIGATKGIGALYIKAKTPIKPIIYGGGQEKGLRSGTQNVPGALSFAKKTEDSIKNMKSNYKKLIDYRNILYSCFNKFSNIFQTVEVKKDDSSYLPNIVHICVKNFESETLILQYNKFNIEVSGGPACSSLSKESSHVLRAIEIPNNYAEGALRISYNENTTKEDIKKFIEITEKIFINTP